VKGSPVNVVEDAKTKALILAVALTLIVTRFCKRKVSLISLCIPLAVKRYANANFVKGVVETVDNFKHGFTLVFDFRLIVTSTYFLLLWIKRITIIFGKTYVCFTR